MPSEKSSNFVEIANTFKILFNRLSYNVDFTKYKIQITASPITPSKTDTVGLCIRLYVIAAIASQIIAVNPHCVNASVGIRLVRLLNRYIKSKVIKEPTAAITWLSVKEEINIPIAIHAVPSKKNPMILLYARDKRTSVPYIFKINGYRQITKIPIPKRETTAKNLPRMIFVIDTGAVYKSWFVF